MIGKAYRYLVVYAVCFIISCFILISCGQKSSITTKSPANISRAGTAAAAAQGKIYLIGGFSANDGDEVQLVEEYDPLKDSWNIKSPMPTARSSLQAVEIGGNIYAIGGRKGNVILSTVEKYNSLTDTWNMCSSMPTARWYHMAVAVNGKIYVMGGISGVGNQRKVLDIVELYDPEKDTWTELSSMPVKRSNAAVVAMGNRIYIISGRLASGPNPSTTTQVDVYDTAKDTWLQVSPLKKGRSGSEACVLDSKIYVIGGASRGKALSSIEVYDPQTDSWKIGFALKQPRTDHSCEVVGNSIYIMTGASSPSLILTSVEELTPTSLTP